MIPSLPSRRLLSALAWFAFLGLFASCATPATDQASDIIMVPWSGPSSSVSEFPLAAQPLNQDLTQAQGAVIDVAFQPTVTYALFVPQGKMLYIETSAAERWFLWLRGLTNPFSAVVYGNERATFEGPDVILLSVAYITGREHNPFFGRIVHVEDAPKMTGPNKSLRAIWERRGTLQEDLVVRLSVR